MTMEPKLPINSRCTLCKRLIGTGETFYHHMGTLTQICGDCVRLAEEASHQGKDQNVVAPALFTATGWMLDCHTDLRQPEIIRVMFSLRLYHADHTLPMYIIAPSLVDVVRTQGLVNVDFTKYGQQR